jgi:hypothetical protein
MKRLLFSAALALFAIGAFAQTTASASSSSPESELLNINKSLYQAFLQENAATLETLLGNEYVLVNNDGNLVDRETLIGAFRDGYVTIESAETMNDVTKMYGDVALVKGLWKSKGSVQGAGFDHTNYYTTIYNKRNGTWKAVSMQFTLVK